MNTGNSERLPAWVPAAVYLVLALAWTWPLPLFLTTRIASDLGDPLLVAYLLWWNAHVVPLSHAMWNPPFYWPMHDPLALTEHGAGMGIVASPIQWLGGSPLLAYNLLLILSTWWSGLAAHALVRRLSGSTIAALCGGLAFAFAPYRASQLPHLHLLVTWWLPLALLGLHAYQEEGRTRWLVLFGVAWLLQSLTSGYYMLFMPLLFGGWLVTFVGRDQIRRGVTIAGTWLLFSLPLIAVLLKYHTVQQRLGLSRSRAEMRDYSAHWTSFLDRAEMLAFWPASHRVTPEAVLFPGLTIVLVLLAGVVIARRQFAPAAWRQFGFYLAAALMTAWMTFGPPVDPHSIENAWRAYAWIAWLPGFSGLRVPARFFMLTTLCLSIAGGLAVAALGARFPRYGVAIGTAVSLGLLADGWIEAMPVPLPPGRFAAALDKNAVVLELPVTEEAVNIAALYRSMLHRAPLVNGYGGYTPPHVRVIGWSLFRHDGSVLTELRRGHPLYVVVAPGPEAPEWTAFMDGQPDATMLGVSGAGRVYEMPAAPYALQVATGTPLPARYDATHDDWLTFDLMGPTAVRAVELRTEGNLRLVRDPLRVETSDDGKTWSLSAETPAGAAALVGALTQPLSVPLRVNLPDPLARFVRLNAPAFNPAAVTVYAR